MAKYSNEPSYRKNLALLSLLFLSVGAIALASDRASAQQPQRLQAHRAATGTNPPQRTNTAPDTTPVAVPSLDKASALGQALAACNQETAVQETITLPGLKVEVTLDRCYKGRAHLICVFTALSTEGQISNRQL